MRVNRKIEFSLIFLVFALLCCTPRVFAQPYGTGKFGADVPYGSETSLAISTSGNVSLQVTPSDSGASASTTSNVTVTSTDVTGYKLYIRALSSTNMLNGPSSLPASSNVVLGVLANNTWGYNTDGSTNYLGISLTDSLIKDAVGPYSSGDTSQIKYGVKIDNSLPAGNYVANIVYTAVPQTD